MAQPRTKDELRRMARAGQIVAMALDAMREAIEPGISTIELDRLAEDLIRKQGGVPSFKGYHGFPATICTSVNEQIVHGIPGDRKLHDGEIISVDVGAIWEDYHADAAITVAVGHVSSEEVRRLLRTTEDALMAGIEAARAGERLGDVSHAIEAVADAARLGVIREYGGHGIGRAMHESPRIPNWGRAGQGILLRPGMAMALEPMLTLGGEKTRVLPDRWTVVTADGSLSAHFEHTIAVTDDGPVILTRVDNDLL
ncbi:MAG TPA: type I methionyl aminopeptidase [Chloroflexi bacterium]|jgi:methionyl aminopeptidase|nr:type I methionyl aminopeptidase [Chloroflexota bacterium]